MLRRRDRRTKLRFQSRGGKGSGAAPGHPGERQALEGHPNGQEAGATTARETATAPALIESWKGSETARGRRGMARTGIGTEGTGRDSGPAAQTGTKTVENAEEVAAAAGTEGANAKTKKGMAGMTGAGGRTGITIKIEELRGRDPGIRRAGERLMIEDIKMTGIGTEKTGRPKGQAGVEAGREGTKLGVRRKAGKESAATAERGTGSETENNVLTNVVVAKRGVNISASLVTTRVNTVIAEGVRALSKR